MAIQKNNTELKYEVKEECGIISTRKGKYGDEHLRLRYMSWNDRDPRYDIRPWYPDENGKECPAKMRSLTGEELAELGKIINKLAEE